MALECETEEAELPWAAWGSKMLLQSDRHTTQEVNSGDPLISSMDGTAERVVLH